MLSPLLLFVPLAAGMGFAVHKKQWGIATFVAALLAYVLTMQLATAILDVVLVLLQLSHGGGQTSYTRWQ
jgi:p-aminobenzoyl-glutamate transporter AbgT